MHHGTIDSDPQTTESGIERTIPQHLPEQLSKVQTDCLHFINVFTTDHNYYVH